MTAFQEPWEGKEEEENEDNEAGWQIHRERRDFTTGTWRVTHSLHKNYRLERCFAFNFFKVTTNSHLPLEDNAQNAGVSMEPGFKNVCAPVNSGLEMWWQYR